MPLEGVTLPGYRILRPLGAGGMAELFLAERAAASGASRRVVLKRILPGFASDPHFRQLFVHEARIAMQLTHANIVQVYDFLEGEGTYVLAMEYIEGCDLRRLVRARGALPIDVSLYICAHVLRGLDYAHRHRSSDGAPLEIVHRDVSPGNILLSTEGEVKLTDFGLARSRERLGHSVGEVKGTFAFMSPEQAEGRPVDARADVFAAATVLFAMLTGESPFQADGPVATLDRVRAGAYRPLGELLPGAPPGLAEVVDRGLARAVEARYPAADAMREALEEVAQRAGERLSPDALAALVRPTSAEVSSATSPATSPGHRAVTPSAPVPADSVGTPAPPLAMAAATLPLGPGDRRRKTGSRKRRAGVVSALVASVTVSGLFVVRARHAPPAGPSVTVAPSQVPPSVLPNPHVDEPPAVTPIAVKPSGPSKPRPGFLTINSDPWAYVTIDGKRRGATPLIDLAIAPGAHEVALVNPPLGATKSALVRLRSGEHRTLIEKLSKE
jgi:serine/threonine-protein kinase